MSPFAGHLRPEVLVPSAVFGMIALMNLLMIGLSLSMIPTSRTSNCRTPQPLPPPLFAVRWNRS